MRRYTDSAIFKSRFHPTTVSNADKVEKVIRVIKPSMSVISSQQIIEILDTISPR